MKLSVRQLKGLIKEAIGEAGTMYVLYAGRYKSLIGVFSSKQDALLAKRHFDGITSASIRTVKVDPTDEEVKAEADAFAAGADGLDM